MSRSKIWIFIFVIVITGYFTGISFDSLRLQLIFKPLLMASLLVYFFTKTKGFSTVINILVTSALLFSIAGDTLLMFVEFGEIFFILGLVCFLFTQLCYILLFSYIHKIENLKATWLWAIPVLAYYAMFMYKLAPHLGSQKIPVFIYAIVISGMLYTALRLNHLKPTSAAYLLMGGALLFVISDSVLAFNKFYEPIVYNEWIIMISYVAAQFLIISGIITYLNDVQPEE